MKASELKAFPFHLSNIVGLTIVCMVVVYLCVSILLHERVFSSLCLRHQYHHPFLLLFKDICLSVLSFVFVL